MAEASPIAPPKQLTNVILQADLQLGPQHYKGKGCIEVDIIGVVHTVLLPWKQQRGSEGGETQKDRSPSPCHASFCRGAESILGTSKTGRAHLGHEVHCVPVSCYLPDKQTSRTPAEQGGGGTTWQPLVPAGPRGGSQSVCPARLCPHPS